VKSADNTSTLSSNMEFTDIQANKSKNFKVWILQSKFTFPSN
jgi:hypothetical protein